MRWKKIAESWFWTRVLLSTRLTPQKAWPWDIHTLICNIVWNNSTFITLKSCQGRVILDRWLSQWMIRANLLYRNLSWLLTTQHGKKTALQFQARVYPRHKTISIHICHFKLIYTRKKHLTLPTYFQCLCTRGVHSFYPHRKSKFH